MRHIKEGVEVQVHDVAAGGEGQPGFIQEGSIGPTLLLAGDRQQVPGGRRAIVEPL
jgi:hypothetical protein